jgi:hypothetical protein
VLPEPAALPTLVLDAPAPATTTTTTTFAGPKKPRRLLGLAQNQAGVPVVVETVKPDGST